MLVAFPSSIAFGVVIYTAASPELASIGALAGIIGAAVLGIVAPLVSRNGGFITAPCAPAAAVLAGVALQWGHEAHGDLGRVLALLAFTALLSALFQIVYGVLRAGRLIKYIPYQVVNGYLSGVAVIIALAQIPRFLGAPADEGLGAVLLTLRLWSVPAIVIGLATIVAMIAATHLVRSVPAPIVGLGFGVVAYGVFAAMLPALRTGEGNPFVIGPIRAGGSLLAAMSGRISSTLSLSASDLALVIGPALTLSVLLSIDTLKTGVVLDVLTRRRHDSNRELIAQGVANLGSFTAGGMPGAATMGPTLVNVTSGGRSLWSGVAEGTFVLVAFLLLGKLVAWVPVAALAGILLVIAWRMFHFEMFRLALLPATRLDFFVIASVVLVAATVGLIEASVVGICLAILLFIRNQMRGSVILRRTDLTVVRSKRRRSRGEVALLDQYGTEAMVVQLKDDLFFGTTDQLFMELEHDLASRRWMLLDFRRVQSMDYTAAQLFTQMNERLRERDGMLLFSGMPSGVASRQDIERYMGELGLVGRSSGLRVFETRESALEWMEQRVLELAGWSGEESGRPLRIEEIGVLRNLHSEVIAHLGHVIMERTAAGGEKVFAAGTSGDEIFFVRRGRVDILLPLEGGKRHHLATLCRGEFFGEMSFLDRGVRSADAEAAVESELFVLSRSRFDEAAQTGARFTAPLFEQLALALARRIRITDAELRTLEER